MLETFSSVYIENNELKLKTPHSNYTLTPAGGNVFTTQLTSGHKIDIIFAQANGVWYYQIPKLFINAKKTSPLLKPISMGLLIAFFISLPIMIVAFVTLLLRRFFNKPNVKIKSLVWFLLSPLFLVGVIICLGSAGQTGMPLMILGQPTIQSIGVTIGLLLFSMSALVALYYYFTTDYPILRKERNKAVSHRHLTYFIINHGSQIEPS